MAIGRFLLAWRRSREATLVAHPDSPHRMKAFSRRVALADNQWLPGRLHVWRDRLDRTSVLQSHTAERQRYHRRIGDRTVYDTVAFGLYRSLDEGSCASRSPCFQRKEARIPALSYSYRDANVVAGVLYYYALQEVTSSGGTITVASPNAGIEVPAQIRIPTLLLHPRLRQRRDPELYLPLVLR